MDDLISRQAVIEINRSYHGQMPNEVNHRIWKEINELPSAQPDLEEAYICGETEAEARFHAEIVRCKDCVHYDTGFPYDRCVITDKYAEEDDFCSWAERRTDG